MPAIWASSERPLFVRTVWVDGMRHAVLTPDDPVVNPRLRRRARTSKEKSFPAMRQQTESRLDRLNSCFTNLHVVVEKNFPDRDKIPARIVRRQSAPPCTRMCAEKTGGLLEIYVNNVDKLDENRENCQTPEKEETTSVSADEAVLDCSSSVGKSLCLRRHTISTVLARKQVVDRSSDVHWNPLSERVLQWLDLSGRAQDYDLEAESEGSLKPEDDRRWSAVRKRRHYFPQRREGSALMTKERIVVQNYKLQKNCKLECLAKTVDDEVRFPRKRLPKIKDARTEEDEARKEENAVLRVSSGVSTKNRVLNATEDDSKGDEGEPRDGLLAMWSPPGRLQLHIVMPNFSFVEKRASSLESLVCD
ncbi:uncharacterized protein LOC116851082 [Odontomachus brunneus]|uniref:uncharacterized protein LOC116851082 n=1 Tax=Odontomachus brunneus TaxID=486640 RepID=UPI0013F297E5|nr:uncharacterized protein LOC116851082 [Odontomachus brunneus]